MNEYLEHAYDSWHRMQSTAAEDPLQMPWYRSVFPHIQKYARGHLLEVGCGRGQFAVWLAGMMPSLKITAIDFSHDAIVVGRKLAQNAGVDVNFIQQDALSMSLPGNSFDYVVSCECLEHVPNPKKMAAEISRVLKPEGRFCLTTENYFNGMLLAWAHSWITSAPFNSGSGVQPHENFFFFWHVRKYLESARLTVELTDSCHFQWLLLPGVDPARLRTNYFSSSWARYLTKPFGRHFSFFGHKLS